jgi:hypothetical protein
MLGSLYDHVFGCAHRELTRPITPVSRPGVPSGETYVVCLDCGRQFLYDWDHMRIGKPIDRTSPSGVLEPRPPARHAPGKGVAYALIGSAIPLAWLVGRALAAKPRRGEPAPVAPSGAGAASGQSILLPHGGPGARFPVRALLDYVAQSERDHIALGAVSCVLADHPEPHSLDYWLRQYYARNKDVMQVTESVVSQLTGTGLFEEVERVSPDTREPSRTLKVKG